MLGTPFPILRMFVAAATGSLGLLWTAEQSAGQSPRPSNALYESTVSTPLGSPSPQSAGGFLAGASEQLPSVELTSFTSTIDDACDCAGGPFGRSCKHGTIGPRGCDDRWYLSLSGGWQQRERVQEAGEPTTFIEFDDGFSINGAVGYRFDRLRIEAEYTFMNNECSMAGAGGLSSNTVGNVNLKAFMLNAYRDFEIEGWQWKPYVGGGIGTYQSELNGLFPEFFQTIGGDFATSPINATSNMPFAYQFRAGASRPLGERTNFFSAYRYFHGNEMQFSSAPFASGAAPTFNPQGAWTHGLEFGLRVSF